MTTQRLNQLMILTISRAAQLVYVGDSGPAYEVLSGADRLFRYLASPDRIVPLSDELRILEQYASLDATLDVELRGFDSAAGKSWGRVSCPGYPEVFVEKLSLIDSVLDLSELPLSAGRIVVEPAPEGSDAACRVSRGGVSRLTGCA
jgi:hypothetical protein